MASRSIPSFFGPAAILLVLSMTASAQNKPIADDPDIAAIRKEVESAYAPLETALRSDKVFVDRLTAELKAASSEKDPARRKAALATYASKYAAEYGKFADKAGIRMDKVVAGLNARYKGFEFRQDNTYGIVFRKKRSKSPSKGGRTSSPPGPRTLRLSFNNSRDSDCGAVSGHAQLFTERSMTISNWAAVAGGCMSHGELRYEGELPATARSIIFRLGYTLSAEGSAVGVVGFSISTAYTIIEVKVGDRALIERPEMIRDEAIAPFLWVATFDSGDEDFNDYDVTSMKGQRLNIFSYSYVYAVSAICCGTGATAVTRLPTAELVVTD